eukprot:NODE_101_length_20473_cov_0.516590.p5 type:complete len:258 gc:universal NODE_101_length_20473_cov_0.516590:190-963(+)
MLFVTFVTSLVSSKPLHFERFRNVKLGGLYDAALSGDLSCLLLNKYDGLYCWDTYDLYAALHHKNSPDELHSISIYGNYACAGYRNVYCTKNFKEGYIDWVLVYSSSDNASLSVELDGNIVCITSKDSVKCANFFTLFSDEQVWREKKVIQGPLMDISISGELACVNYNQNLNSTICTDDFSADSPNWKALDAPVFSVKINKKRKCGLDINKYFLTCYQDGKWITATEKQYFFALDDTHIITYDLMSIGTHSVSRFT